MHVKLPNHNCIYNRLPEDEPSGSKHVEDNEKKNKNENINLENMHFVGWYCIAYLISLSYGSLVTRTVVRLAAAKLSLLHFLYWVSPFPILRTLSYPRYRMTSTCCLHIFWIRVTRILFKNSDRTAQELAHSNLGYNNNSVDAECGNNCCLF